MAYSLQVRFSPLGDKSPRSSPPYRPAGAAGYFDFIIYLLTESSYRGIFTELGLDQYLRSHRNYIRFALRYQTSGSTNLFRQSAYQSTTVY